MKKNQSFSNITFAIALCCLAACSKPIKEDTKQITKPKIKQAWSQSCLINQQCNQQTLPVCGKQEGKALNGVIALERNCTEMMCNQGDCCNTCGLTYVLTTKDSIKWHLVMPKTLVCRSDESAICCANKIPPNTVITVAGKPTQQPSNGVPGTWQTETLCQNFEIRVH